MPRQPAPPDLIRRCARLAAWPWLAPSARASDGPLRAAIVGAARGRVVSDSDPTAHAELLAIRDAARTLRTRDLAGCVLVSTARPCRMCEAAAAWGGIARMVHGAALTDAGAPR